MSVQDDVPESSAHREAEEAVWPVYDAESRLAFFAIGVTGLARQLGTSTGTVASILDDLERCRQAGAVNSVEADSDVAACVKRIREESERSRAWACDLCVLAWQELEGLEGAREGLPKPITVEGEITVDRRLRSEIASAE